jgi:hypothetical protein
MFARPENNASINLTSPSSGNITFGMQWQTKLIAGKRKERLFGINDSCETDCCQHVRLYLEI